MNITRGIADLMVLLSVPPPETLEGVRHTGAQLKSMSITCLRVPTSRAVEYIFERALSLQARDVIISG